MSNTAAEIIFNFVLYKEYYFHLYLKKVNLIEKKPKMPLSGKVMCLQSLVTSKKYWID